MKQLLTNIEFKKMKYRKEEYKIIQTNEHAIIVLAPLSIILKGDSDWRKTLEDDVAKLVEDCQISITCGEQEMCLTLDEDTLFTLQEAGRYSLWLDAEKIGLQKEFTVPYSIKLGNRILLPEKESEIQKNAICVAKNLSFDSMYDMKKLLFQRNPCKVSIVN